MVEDTIACCDTQTHTSSKLLPARFSHCSSQDVLKIYAFYKQATVGDAPLPEEKPFDTLGREKWEVWDKWRGTPSDVAKRRYITYLRDIDENLVYVAVNEKPPWGFPKTR